jgi:hypothetical protein
VDERGRPAEGYGYARYGALPPATQPSEPHPDPTLEALVSSWRQQTGSAVGDTAEPEDAHPVARGRAEVPRYRSSEPPAHHYPRESAVGWAAPTPPSGHEQHGGYEPTSGELSSQGRGPAHARPDRGRSDGGRSASEPAALPEGYRANPWSDGGWSNGVWTESAWRSATIPAPGSAPVPLPALHPVPLPAVHPLPPPSAYPTPPPPAEIQPARERMGEATMQYPNGRLPRRIPAAPDVPAVPGGESGGFELTPAAPALARIASFLSREDAKDPAPRPDGFDFPAVLKAVRGVSGVRDAVLRTNEIGVPTLRLELADDADPAQVSREVARLLKERMGLAAEPSPNTSEMGSNPADDLPAMAPAPAVAPVPVSAAPAPIHAGSPPAHAGEREAHRRPVQNSRRSDDLNAFTPSAAWATTGSGNSERYSGSAPVPTEPASVERADNTGAGVAASGGPRAASAEVQEAAQETAQPDTTAAAPDDAPTAPGAEESAATDGERQVGADQRPSAAGRPSLARKVDLRSGALAEDDRGSYPAAFPVGARPALPTLGHNGSGPPRVIDGPQASLPIAEPTDGVGDDLMSDMANFGTVVSSPAESGASAVTSPATPGSAPSSPEGQGRQSRRARFDPESERPSSDQPVSTSSGNGLSPEIDPFSGPLSIPADVNSNSVESMLNGARQAAQTAPGQEAPTRPASGCSASPEPIGMERLPKRPPAGLRPSRRMPAGAAVSISHPPAVPEALIRRTIAAPFASTGRMPVRLALPARTVRPRLAPLDPRRQRVRLRRPLRLRQIRLLLDRVRVRSRLHRRPSRVWPLLWRARGGPWLSRRRTKRRFPVRPRRRRVRSRLHRRRPVRRFPIRLRPAGLGLVPLSTRRTSG